jgi:Fe-S cluster biosynthesis and repair protein YggX
MDLNARIAQFENMAQADPSNEMAHFSLGTAYAQAGRPADAAESYLKAVALMPDMSKAYQLAGENLVKAGQGERAKSVLLQGYIIAAQKGDLMPKNAMAALLKSLGETPPEVEATKKSVSLLGGGGAGGGAPHQGPVPEGMIVCAKTGRLGTRMARAPFRGPVGGWIAANISKETFFQGWVPQGTKVINELRLDLSREKDQEMYDQHMREYLGLDEATLAGLKG